MTTNTDNSPRIEVLVQLSGGAVDVEATVTEARRVAVEYANADKEASAAIVAVVNKIVTNDKYKDVTTFTAGTLAKMALGLMGEIPTDKLCAEAEVRCKSYLQSQGDKFIFIERGRNAGFHFISRLKATAAGQEQLAKLLKEKAASDAKKAAEAAAASAPQEAAAAE